MLPFTILMYTGLWKPIGWSHNWRSKCYDTYTFFVIILLYSYCVFDTINMCYSLDNREELTNTVCLLMSFLSAFYKALSILRKREKIINLESMLRNEECRPHDFHESVIQSECDRDARALTAFYTSMSLAVCCAMLVTSFIDDFPERKMPFNSWLPYSYSSSIQFALGYVYLIYTALVFVSIAAGVDCLIFCLMLNTSAQLKILNYRLLKMPRSIGAANSAGGSAKSDRDSSEIVNFERQIIAECIRHQCNIFQFAELLNENFTYIIFVQFTTSSIVLCLSVLELTKFRILSSNFMFILGYLAIMTIQIFLFCWYGDNVIVQSLDVAVAAYEMDWITLSNSTKKYLLMIIARSLKPIKFTSGHIIVLSIDSYNSLVKLSYSIYNVLSQPTET